MKKFLITGSDGYIGTNFCEVYAQKANFKLCDKNTELPKAQDLEVDHIKDCDGIVHFAALSGIQICEEDPATAAVDNVATAANVFKIATKRNIPVVFCSSQAAKDPKTSNYAMMKWTCERLADYYNAIGGKIYVVRLANVYGGYYYLTKKSTCIKQFITRYKSELPLEVHGNGNQIRDFVHVWDVCEAIYRLVDTKPYCRIPIDVGTGKGYSILDVVEMFPRMVSKFEKPRNHHYSFTEGRDAGVDSATADISVLKVTTGFVPERKLEDYIKGEIKNG